MRMACPWAKIEQLEAPNLTEIMSEEVARDLQEKENKKHLQSLNIDDLMYPSGSSSSKITNSAETIEEIEDTNTCSSDETIARMLQLQFDKEHDEDLKRAENKFNGTNKVSISLDNYRRAPLGFSDSEDSSEEIEDIRDRRDWDRFDTLQRQINSIPPCGYKIQNGSIITKHDVTMSGRKNACKLLSFPPEFQTGDGELFDLKLSNKVFNSLKMHSRNEQVKRHRIHDRKEDHATAEFGLDEYTRLLIYKLINQEIIESVNGIISIGKEAVVLHANAEKECVLKVFKTTLSEFKQRDKYIKDDYRFKDRVGKLNARKTVHLWAEKEMHNLNRVKKAGIPCPEVVALKKHVLVMSFVGEDHKPAPKLKDAILDDADYAIAYKQIVEAMKNLYTRGNLIHADLSEYNILWYENKCYFIDLSQAVEPTHENSFHFLMRDCNNVTNFFSKKKLSYIYEAGELFKMVTGCYFTDKMKLMEIQDSYKMKPHLVDKPGIKTNYDFDKAWEVSQNDPKLIDAPKA